MARARVNAEPVTFQRDGDTIRGSPRSPARRRSVSRPGADPRRARSHRALSRHRRAASRPRASSRSPSTSTVARARPTCPTWRRSSRWIAALPDPRVLADLAGAVRYLAGATRRARRRDRHHRLLPRRPVRADGRVQRAGPRRLRLLVRHAALRRAQRAEAGEPARARAAPRAVPTSASSAPRTR